MRTTTAYFAGVGTVAVAIAAGLGGGLLFSNIVAPHQPKYATEPTKLEQRMADRTIAMTPAPSEPLPNQAATQPIAAIPAVGAAPAPTESQTPAAPPPVEQKPSIESRAVDRNAANAANQAAQQTQREPTTSPREAFAKVRDSDLRSRDADMKRAVAEKRRAERHEQWNDRRRTRQPREQEIEAVEQSVRDATEPRQAFVPEPVRLDTPRIRLFGDD